MAVVRSNEELNKYTESKAPLTGTGASGTWGISVTGNAATASALQTTRTITMSGDVSGSTSFDGSGNVTLVATVANDSHTHTFNNLTSKPTTLQGYGVTPEEMPANVDLDTITVTGLYSQSANAEATLVLNYPVASAGLLEVFAYATMIHQRYWVYSSNDTYYRAKYGTGSWTPWTKGANVDDAVAMATKLATARTIALTGDVAGSVNFDGSANVNITTTVADDSHNHIISNIDGLQEALDSFDAAGISDLVDEVALKAYANNATLTGIPVAPTASVGTSTTQLATTAFVVAEINKIEEW